MTNHEKMFVIKKFASELSIHELFQIISCLFNNANTDCSCSELLWFCVAVVPHSYKELL